MKRLENATHFAEVTLDGKHVHVRAGKLGKKGTTTTKTHHNKAVAKRGQMKVVAEYKEDGYRMIQPPMQQHPRNATLEAAIRADRNDRGVYQVYADWLQGQGSAIGELIVLDQANKQAEAHALRATLGLPDEDVASLEWKWGLWRALRFNNHDHQDEAFDAVAFMRDLFSSTMCGALEELRLGMGRWDHNHEDDRKIIEEAGEHAWAADLRMLRVGDVDADIDMAHHAIGEVGAAISQSFPRLHELQLHSGDQGWRGAGETFGVAGLDLPELAILVVETCAMTRARLAALLAAKLPAMHRLELWFGSRDRDCDVDLAALAPLLAGERHAGVTVLGLRNCDFADELAERIPHTPIAARLHRLDLSMGTLGDTGAYALAQNHTLFPALDELVVDDSFLTPAGLHALEARFPHVISHAQKTPYDGDERYVSVGE